MALSLNTLQAYSQKDSVDWTPQDLALFGIPVPANASGSQVSRLARDLSRSLGSLFRELDKANNFIADPTSVGIAKPASMSAAIDSGLTNVLNAIERVGGNTSVVPTSPFQNTIAAVNNNVLRITPPENFDALQALSKKSWADWTADDLGMFGISVPAAEVRSVAAKISSPLRKLVSGAAYLLDKPEAQGSAFVQSKAQTFTEGKDQLTGVLQQFGGNADMFAPVNIYRGAAQYTPPPRAPKPPSSSTPSPLLVPQGLSPAPPPIPAEEAPALTREYLLSKSTVPRAEAEAEARRVLQNYRIEGLTDPETGKPMDPVQYLADHAQRFGIQDIDRQLNAVFMQQGVDLNKYRTELQVPKDQARQIAENLISMSGYDLQTTPPELINKWTDWVSAKGVDATLEEFQRATGFTPGLRPEYQKGQFYTYDTARDIVSELFKNSGIQTSGYFDDGRSASETFSSWVANSQYRPIEETIAKWNAGLKGGTPVNYGTSTGASDGGIDVTQTIQSILSKEKERQADLQKQSMQQFESLTDYILSNTQPQQFQANLPEFQFGTPSIPFTSLQDQQPFYPTQPAFQTEFQTQPQFQPQFQRPAPTPLITQAQRPTLDQTVQFIESGGMAPTTGAQPMQPISYGELGAFTPQAQPYFTTQPLGYSSPVAEYAATGAIPMREGGEVKGVKAAAQQLASMGRNGDTMLAHITPQEAGLLKALGGSGTINPKTGLPEFFVESLMIGMMIGSSALAIQEQRKQRKMVEAEQARQRQERMQQIARAQQAYQRSGLQDIPVESQMPMIGSMQQAKFDPAMGGVRVGEGIPSIPIANQSAITSLQPAPAAPPVTSGMDEDERRRRGFMMGGGLVALAQGGMPTFEYGGTTGPTNEPRMVKGAGDGMSDNVPATIEGVQEARLANDEFVIPADVVADIGNGSSSSGAKKLYAMMDRIREARHGTTEQPPEINAEKYMPA